MDKMISHHLKSEIFKLLALLDRCTYLFLLGLVETTFSYVAALQNDLMKYQICLFYVHFYSLAGSVLPCEVARLPCTRIDLGIEVERFTFDGILNLRSRCNFRIISY